MPKIPIMSIAGGGKDNTDEFLNKSVEVRITSVSVNDKGVVRLEQPL